MKEEFKKINAALLVSFWRNMVISLASIATLMLMSKFLPVYLAPISSIVFTVGMYLYIMHRHNHDSTPCQLVIYGFAVSLTVYSFVLIGFNMLHIWKIVQLRPEFSFISKPFVPSLLLCPICCITLFIVYLRRQRLRFWDESDSGEHRMERGYSMAFINKESIFQLKNLIWVFAFATLILWGYYRIYFDRTNVNDRDRYIFLWLFLMIIVAEIVYFTIRYSNLYQELRHADIIITPQELNAMPTTIYVRYYVVCGNYVYLKCDNTEVNERGKVHDAIASPFLITEKTSDINVDKAKKTIQKLTGVENGNLRFFFGRELPGISKVKIYRYFYFLDGSPEDYPELKKEGEWIDFEHLKFIYATTPWRFSKITIRDITRLVTIFITEKTFKENGVRRNALKSYRPTFDLIEVRNSDLNLNDDKWIRISEFNSDTKFYHLKRLWRKIIGTDRRSFTGE